MLSSNLEMMKQLKLLKMAEMYEAQALDTSLINVSFDQRLHDLLDEELIYQQSGKSTRLIKQAGFPITASLNDVLYTAERNLKESMIDTLRSNDYLRYARNVLITGAAGCGKTWLSCALGTNACMDRKRVKYFTFSEYINECETRRAVGHYRKWLKHILKYDLIILDDFVLSATCDENEIMTVLELIDSRCQHKSTIIASQWQVKGWHDRLGGGPMADSILDRIIYNSYNIELKGRSLRERLAPQL